MLKNRRDYNYIITQDSLFQSIIFSFTLLFSHERHMLKYKNIKKLIV